MNSLNINKHKNVLNITKTHVFRTSLEVPYNGALTCEIFATQTTAKLFDI